MLPKTVDTNIEHGWLLALPLSSIWLPHDVNGDDVVTKLAGSIPRPAMATCPRDIYGSGAHGHGCCVAPSALS
jgi:hypothetical protein